MGKYHRKSSLFGYLCLVSLLLVVPIALCKPNSSSHSEAKHEKADSLSSSQQSQQQQKQNVTGLDPLSSQSTEVDSNVVLANSKSNHESTSSSSSSSSSVSNAEQMQGTESFQQNRHAYAPNEHQPHHHQHHQSHHQSAYSSLSQLPLTSSSSSSSSSSPSSSSTSSLSSSGPGSSAADQSMHHHSSLNYANLKSYHGPSHSQSQPQPSQHHMYHHQMIPTSQIQPGKEQGHIGSTESQANPMMMPKQGHFTLIANQQVSPGHVTMIGYTTPIVKVGGFVSGPPPSQEAGSSSGLASSMESSSLQNSNIRYMQPQSSIEPEQSAYSQQMSNLIATAVAASSAPQPQTDTSGPQMSQMSYLRPLAVQSPLSYITSSMPGSPKTHESLRSSPQESTAAAVDAPVKMLYDKYEQQTRLPYQLSGEDSKSFFSAPLTKAKPFIVYKPGFGDRTKQYQQMSMNNKMISDKSLNSIPVSELQSNDIGQMAGPYDYQSLSLNRMPESYSQHRSIPKQMTIQGYGRVPSQLASHMPMPVSHQHVSYQQQFHQAQPQQQLQSMHSYSQPPQQSSSSFYKQAPMYSRPHETYGQSQKLQMDQSTSSIHMPQQGSSQKIDPKTELQNQINLMVTTSPNLSDDNRGRQREDIMNAVQESMRGKMASESAALKQQSSPMSSNNEQFSRYREFTSHEEPVKMVTYVDKSGQLQSQPQQPGQISASYLQRQTESPMMSKYQQLPPVYLNDAGSQLKSAKVQQKIQQFLEEQMIAEQKNPQLANYVAGNVQAVLQQQQRYGPRKMAGGPQMVQQPQLIQQHQQFIHHHPQQQPHHMSQRYSQMMSSEPEATASNMARSQSSPLQQSASSQTSERQHQDTHFILGRTTEFLQPAQQPSQSPLPQSAAKSDLGQQSMLANYRAMQASNEQRQQQAAASAAAPVASTSSPSAATQSQSPVPMKSFAYFSQQFGAMPQSQPQQQAQQSQLMSIPPGQYSSSLDHVSSIQPEPGKKMRGSSEWWKETSAAAAAQPNHTTFYQLVQKK